MTSPGLGFSPRFRRRHDAGADIHVTNDRTTSSVEENLIAVKQVHTEADARFADYPLSSDASDH